MTVASNGRTDESGGTIQDGAPVYLVLYRSFPGKPSAANRGDLVFLQLT